MPDLLCIPKDCKDPQILKWLLSKEIISSPLSGGFYAYSLKDDKVFAVQEPLRLPVSAVIVPSFTILRKYLIEYLLIGD